MLLLAALLLIAERQKQVYLYAGSGSGARD